MESDLSKITSDDDVKQALCVLVKGDPDLARALKTVEAARIQVPLRLRPGGFAGLVEIVIAQLVSKASANAINKRFLEQVNPPSAQQYLDVGEVTWRSIGLSRPKQAAICAIATAIINGQLELDKLGNIPLDQAMNELIAIKGIGPWTAQVYLLFCEGHPDIFPSGDLALREAARFIWSMEERPSDKQLDTLAQRWSPWRGVAARLLWALYAVNKGGSGAMP